MDWERSINNPGKGQLTYWNNFFGGDKAKEKGTIWEMAAMGAKVDRDSHFGEKEARAKGSPWRRNFAMSVANKVA